MKAVGRNLANVQKGEAPITIGYDLQAATWRDRLKGQVPLEVVVPSEGVFFMPGALMINHGRRIRTSLVCLRTLS